MPLPKIDGYKTYITGTFLIAVAVILHLTGQTTQVESVLMSGLGILGITLRDAIPKH